MFHQHQNGSTTLPRGFRFHHNEGDLPTTPEPFNRAESEGPPSPPRPTRLKVRRRNVSSLQAPTEQFLASVAAADVPIPTIEEPQIATPHVSDDCDMPDRDPLSISTSFLAPHTYYSRRASPPKTPIPTMANTTEITSDHLDWRMGSLSPSECEIERPSSAASNSSDDSFYSGGRMSRHSEDGSCTSPESDISDPFTFPSYSKTPSKNTFEEATTEQRNTVLNAKLRSKTRNDARWTPAMSAHLWSIYLLYLQDPVVTPFRIGASAVPPEGVCHRVARQAKKSWKGPKGVHAASSSVQQLSRAASSDKSGSATPTAEALRSYSQWPHTSSATRAHLRELCKTKDTSSVQRHRHLQSRSPTPFSNQNSRSRFRTPEPKPSAPTSFATEDIALSLTTSTSESMQPDGPLARLATDTDSVMADPKKPNYRLRVWRKSRGMNLSLDDSKSRSLGSPFMARTYGPSSTMDGSFDLPRPSASRLYSDTMPVPGPRLRSPLNFDRPRAQTTTQKRRAQNSLHDALTSGAESPKPNALDEQLYGTSFTNGQRRVRTRAFTVGGDLLRNRIPGLFQPCPSPSTPSHSHEPERSGLVPEFSPSPAAPARLLPPVTFEPPRLRSPFMESGPNTFPRRLFQEHSPAVRRSGVATMHQSHRSIGSLDFGESRNLDSRLSQLDQKLAEIRRRESTNRNRDG
ncbi:Sm-like ribonucleo protein [Rutstroemia sp. NJR-2017a BVV2]|nr:Sm-like ribonucleo protein [Rutstroemia sp. NJR-2017a BVV2]